MNPWVLAGVALWWAVCLRHLAPQWYYLPNYAYGWAVPFLCAYLASERWPDAPAPAPAGARGGGRPRARALALLLGLAGVGWLVVRVVQTANPGWRPFQWAAALLSVGVTLLLLQRRGGWPWLRHFWFPVAFSLTAVPWRTAFESHLIQSLSRLNAAGTVTLLAWLGVPVSQHGNVIETSRGWAGIDEACSGIRSLQATLMLGLFFGELYRLGAVRRVFLVAAGFGLALVCNAARTLTLVWICDRDGLAAMERWHDPTGVALLLICFTGLWAVGRYLAPPTPPAPAKSATSALTPPAAPAPGAGPEPAGPPLPVSSLKSQVSPFFPRWLGPTLVAIVLGVEGITEGWYRYHELGARLAPRWTIHWPPPYDGWKEVTVPPRAATLLRYQTGRAASWTTADGGLWQLFYFHWQGGATESQMAANHSPEVCLPASGRVLERQEPAQDFAVGDLRLPFKRYVFRDRGRLLFAFHCRWEDVRVQGPVVLENRKAASRLEAVRYGRRNLSQRALEVFVWGYPDLATAEAALARDLPRLVDAVE